MKRRRLGREGLEVAEIGLGCMGMSEFYGTLDESESFATIQRALELGVDFFDTADIYGPFTNDQLLGRALRGKREGVIVATKFGSVCGEDGSFRGIDGRPEYVKRCAEASLQRLGIVHIDLYYQHRVDPKVPIEDTVGAMAELVHQGKVRFLGLSEAAPETIERAHRVHPISALQTEYSLFSREPEDAILVTTRKLGIGFVAYSPLCRGLLSGEIKRPEDLAANDRRRLFPRFVGANFQKNLDVVAQVKEIAQERGVTPGQLALAWVLPKGDDIAAIPGTKRRRYLEENVAASGVTLSPSDLARIDAAAPKGVAEGTRYRT